MPCRDPYGLRLTASPDAAAGTSPGLDSSCSPLRSGAAPGGPAPWCSTRPSRWATPRSPSVGHDLCAEVDVAARMRDAERLAAEPGVNRARAQPRGPPSSRTCRATPAPLVAHLAALPRGRPAAVGRGPHHRVRRRDRAAAGGVVDRRGPAPAYGDDWWYAGAARVRAPGAVPVRGGRWRSPAVARRPDSGHAAHARAHVHYETGDHARRARLDGLCGSPATAPALDSLSHLWRHAALHELSLGDLDAVLRRRYDAQLLPAVRRRLPGPRRQRLAARALGPHPERHRRARPAPGGSTSSTGPRTGAPGHPVPRHARRRHPARPRRRLPHSTTLSRWASAPRPPGAALRRRPARAGAGADAVRSVLRGRLPPWPGSRARVRASAAPTRSARSSRRPASPASIRADRYDEARHLLDRRLDRRHSPRDAAWRRTCAS